MRTLLLIACSFLAAFGCQAQNPAATVVYQNGDMRNSLVYGKCKKHCRTKS